MGKIVAAFGSSHAFTFMEPGEWDDFRGRNRQSYQRRQGIEPPEQPAALAETLADNRARYSRILAAHETIRRTLRETRPDALVVIGDDQNELFTDANIPQLALYTGGGFRLSRRFTKAGATYRPHGDLAKALLAQGVRDGFDITALGEMPAGELPSHAHCQVLDAFLPDANIPVVPVFLNAIHHPAIEPRQCYAFGEMLARVIAARPASERVALCASGGWSHFTAGYPWGAYRGPFSYGAISESFDQSIAERLRSGAGRELAMLSGDDLLTHGDIELRTWIAMLGAIGPVPPGELVYQPFYRAVMGMAVASWGPGQVERIAVMPES